MALLESGEMYLETILILSRKSAAVRAIDVANQMGYSKPSVSRALGLLKKEGFIEVDAAGQISLTPDGRRQAETTYERHLLLTDLLIGLGVDRETASADACRVEHYISDATFAAIKAHARQHRP